MSVSLPGMSTEALHQKLGVFGIDSKSDYRNKLKDYPRVRIRENKVKSWKWCHDHLGNNWIWSSPTQTDYCDIYFLHESDALMFKLSNSTA